MKRFLSAALLALFALLLLCGCAPGPINEGETYLDGAWYHSNPVLGLNVGYNFFPDGGGYQFIGSTVNPIRYGVYEGNIYIAVGDGKADVFPFEQNGENIVISGLEYLYAEEDEETAGSIADMVSKEEQDGTQDPVQGAAFYVIAILSFAIAVTLVLLMMRALRKKN